MACTHRLALHIDAPRLPEREWSTRLDIPGVQCPMRAPQGQERTGYAAPCLAIRLIVLAI
jgi:hypothetical protein